MQLFIKVHFFAILALSACGSSGAAPTTTPEGAVPGQHVSEGRAGGDREDEGDRVVPGWPVDSGLPGADAERMRVALDDRPSRGPTDALVTVAVFTDFGCAACGRLSQTLGRLLEAYPSDLRLVFRAYGLPPHGRYAAATALEAYAQRGDDGFWEMHDVLFQEQDSLGPTDVPSYADQVGLDPVRFRRALDDGHHEETMHEDAELVQALSITGLPTSFFNGRRVVGDQSFEALKELVDEEIALARYAIDRGLDRRDTYSSAQSAALDTPPPPPPPPPAPEVDPSAVHHVPVGDSPVLGPADALVTIVEFGDFECVFCSRARQALADLRIRYPRELRIVFKHNPLPFHPAAPGAHRASLEAFSQRGNRGFWRMHDLLFANQRELERADLDGYARTARLNMRRFRRAMDGDAHQATIDRDLALLTSLAAPRGAPLFFINGRFLAGAQPADYFATIIDEELARARERVAAGTARRRVYQETIEGASPTLVYMAPVDSEAD